MAARGAWGRGGEVVARRTLWGEEVAATVAATTHGEVAASRSILDVAKCGIFVYIIC